VKSALNENPTDLKCEEIAQHLHTDFGKHGFGMELDAFELQLTMAQAHDKAVGFGGNLELAGEPFLFHDQRMVTRGYEILRKFAKNGFAIVMDSAGFAVHQRRSAYHITSERVANGLMAEANSKDRDFPSELADDVDANARILRFAGAGRDHDPLRFSVGDFVDGDLVIAPNFELLA